MKNLFLFILFSQVTLFSIAQNSMKNFWQAFNNNQYEEAIKELESFTAANPKDEEGLALLTFMYDSENYPYKAFQSFKKLYAVTSHKTEYIQAFWYTSALNSDSKSTMKERRLFFDEILLNKDIDGSVKSLIHSSIADNYYNMGKFADYWEELAKVKSLNKWQIVGEFENISASGFDKTFGPIENPEQNAKFTNKRKAPIHWFKSEVFQPGQWVRLDYHFIISNSVNYAQTFVNSPIDQEIELRAGVSGSLKAWVNDQLVISEMEEYNNNIDSYRTKIRLKKGWNRVLLQLGTSELSSQNFMVRLTNEKGVDIENITHSNSFQDYPKVGGKDINTKTLEAESFFNDLIKKDPKSIINHILLGRVYLDNGSYDKAHGVIMDLEKLAPKSSIVLWELIKLYSNEDNETDLGACIERIKKEDPMNIFSLSFQFNEAIENENYDKATELLAQLETVSKSEEDIYDKKISLESAKENNQKVIDLAKEAFVKYPENITFLTLKYYIEANVNQNAAAAQKVLKKYLKKNYRSTVQKLYATSFADRNMIPQFLSEYKKLLTVSPYSIGYMLDLSDYYYQTKNFDASIDYLDQAKELAPFIGSIYAKKAKIYADLEKTDDALAQYKKAILYDPTDYTSRDKIREIEEEESPFDVFPEKDYYEIFNNAPSAADFPEDNSILLSQERQIVIHEKGAAEEKYYKLVKVFNKSGVDMWKEYSVPAGSSQYLIIEKAEVLKADGSKNMAETNGRYCVFTNLEPGDGIFITYKLQNYYQGVLADHFWGKQYFEYFVPAQNIEFSMVYDENEIPLKFHVENGTVQSDKKTYNGKTVLRYWAKDVPSIKSESYMPVLSDIGTTLHYTTMKDWKFVADWYQDLSATKAKADYEVIQIVNELFPDGWENLSEAEKINTIYTYIVNEVRYSSISFRQSGLVPQKASKVINTKIGDCKDVSTLFVVMCEVVGIDADLVLVNTRGNGRTDMVLPSIDFNHCIAKVDIDGQENFVELTTDNFAFSTISPYLEQSFILEIDDKKENLQPRLLPGNSKYPNAVYRKTKAELFENHMLVSKESIKTGSRGASMRNSYRDIGEEARRKDMQEAVSGDYASIKLIDVTFDESLNNNTDSVTYNYSYKVNNPFTNIGSLKIVKLPLTDAIEPIEFLSNDTRKYGVELWKYFSYSVAKETLTVVLPTDKKIAEKPKDVVINNDLVDYSLTFKMDGKDLVVQRDILFKKSFIPITEYDLFKSTMEKISTADNLQIGFK